jgi:hypothetical protein
VSLCLSKGCDEDRVMGRRRCEYHLAVWRSSAARARSMRDERGVCVRCGAKKRVTETLCFKCSERKKTYNQLQLNRYKIEGKCIRCGHLRDRIDRKRCSACREYAKQVNARKRRRDDKEK